MPNTKEQFEQVISPVPGVVREEVERLRPSWRIMRPSRLPIRYLSRRTVSVAWRLRDEHGGRGIRPEFIAIVNYGVIGLIQLALGFGRIRPISR